MNATIEHRRVQIYRWCGAKDGRERFYFVDAALEIIQRSGKQPNAEVSLECAQEGLSRNAEAAKLDLRNIAKADLNQPVIFVTVWNEDNQRGGYHPLYHVWRSMMRRCYNPKCKDFPGYGGRGIVVCIRWHSIRKFIQDMDPRPTGMQLERKDNTGNYSPNNVIWATAKINARNRRSSKLLSFNGETLTQAEWAERVGLHVGTLFERLKDGWTIERALTEPVHSEKRNHLCKS